MIKLNSFQSPRNFSWYLTSLRRQRTCSNLQPKRSSTLRMHSSCRDRSLDGKLDRGLDSRPNTYPDVFVKARPHYYQQSLRSMISTERILAFWFSVTRQCNSLASASRKGVEVFSKLWEMWMNGEHHAFRIMVWDVDPIIYLHPTTDKEKVLLPHHNNREEIATSTQSSLQVQRASVARMTPTVNSSDFVMLSFFFFFWFSAKSYAARAGTGDEKHRKKSTWPYRQVTTTAVYKIQPGAVRLVLAIGGHWMHLSYMHQWRQRTMFIAPGCTSSWSMLEDHSAWSFPFVLDHLAVG